MAPAVLTNADPSSSNKRKATQGCRDRLSELPDHLLLIVLGKLRPDVRLVARTCVLSKRWKALPLMLPRLWISADSFLPPTPDSTLPMRCLHQATSKFADALRFFLATDTAGGQRDIRRLSLRFILTKKRRQLHEICRLVSAAVERGEVGALEVALDTVEGADSIWATERGEAVARGYARRFMRLFRAAPAGVVGSSLAVLSLQNLCFLRASDLEGVVCACGALETLVLTYCWFATPSPFRVDAGPRSRLRKLVVAEFFVEWVELVQAPELRGLTCENWNSKACPVRFAPGSAPSFEKMTLANRARPGQLSFKLSELLENANPVEQIHLDFSSDWMWLQPEKQSDLVVAFSKLKRLHVMGLAAGSDISWTMFFIKAAPLLEHVHIRVCQDAVCGSHDDDDAGGGGGGHQDLGWGVPSAEHHFERRHLRTVEICGGIDPGRHSRFLRWVVERAVDLELLVLDAAVTCAGCVAAKEKDDPSFALSKFPEDRDGIDAFVRKVRDGIPTSARIVVRSLYNQEFEY